MLNVDDFKDINNALGHGAGDTVLRHVSRRIQQALRDTDTIARLSGDEFAVILPAATPIARCASSAASWNRSSRRSWSTMPRSTCARASASRSIPRTARRRTP